MERLAQSLLYATAERREGIDAFLEKRHRTSALLRASTN